MINCPNKTSSECALIPDPLEEKFPELKPKFENMKLKFVQLLNVMILKFFQNLVRCVQEVRHILVQEVRRYKNRLNHQNRTMKTGMTRKCLII